ncbi:hypothetical protein E2C01_019680 [Portunus trituberculatus]|uniref:Uncharacterized protein n=1 Tax=Portunus trituberculatus TaxID=210409 RepID=A0A5B7DYL1_PORTR|nr:hypothetical protein [Portunus trituberculatus]
MWSEVMFWVGFVVWRRKRHAMMLRVAPPFFPSCALPIFPILLPLIPPPPAFLTYHPSPARPVILPLSILTQGSGN